MIRILFFCFFALIHASSVLGQKYDNNWLVGYESRIPQLLYYGVSNIDFNADSATVTYVGQCPLDFNWGGSTMSDKNGKMICYSNGCRIMNAQHQPMQNGLDLNPGNLSDMWCTPGYGYPIVQETVYLPMPGLEDSVYQMIHLAGKLVDGPLVIFADKLYYSTIDLRYNNGLGRVTAKNMLILEDTFCYGQMTAVRHGNGRDWWIMLPESSTNRYYKFLLDPQGISGPYPQSIGTVWGFKDWSGQAQFSPDGTKYVRFDTYNHLSVFDFDRCTGDLSNHRYIDVGFDPDTVQGGGVAISPNSRFAYVSTDEQVWQFDLQAPDIKASQILIASLEGFTAEPLNQKAYFYVAQLGPDGRIYINCASAIAYMHIIQHPNEPGLACQLDQHALKLKGLNARTMPHYPNYRLYDVAGSVCDSLGVNTPMVSALPSPPMLGSAQVKVSPNPAHDYIDFQVSAPSFRLQVFDLSGRLWHSSTSVSAPYRLSISTFPIGIYYYRIESENTLPLTGKLIKQ